MRLSKKLLPDAEYAEYADARRLFIFFKTIYYLRLSALCLRHLRSLILSFDTFSIVTLFLVDRFLKSIQRFVQHGTRTTHIQTHITFTARAEHTSVV